MAKASRNRKKSEPSQARVSIYAAWCKRCGNCVEFCPTHALEWDELGYPRLEDPEKCTSCHLCEKLCPDFAIGVRERPPREESNKRITRTSTEADNIEEVRSPERVAPPVPTGNDTTNK